MNMFAALFGLYLIPVMATAAPPAPPEILPEIDAFMCDTATYDNPEQWNPDHSMKGRDWVRDEDGLKQCKRYPFWVTDQSASEENPDCTTWTQAKGLQPCNDKPKDQTPNGPIPLHPNPALVSACNYVAMHLPMTLENPEFKKKLGNYRLDRVGCPRPVFEDGKHVGYAPPECPPDSRCLNEPHGI